MQIVKCGLEFFSSPPRPERLWGPPSLIYNGYQSFFLREVKQLGEWSNTSIPPYVFMMWCLVKHRDNFTFYLMNLELSISDSRTKKTDIIIEVYKML